jgi:hypothetical protein
VWPILDELWEKEFESTAKPRLKLRYVDKGESKKSLFKGGLRDSQLFQNTAIGELLDELAAGV